jgi:hypothetical protein
MRARTPPLDPYPEPTFDTAPVLDIIAQLRGQTARKLNRWGHPQIPHAYVVRGRPPGNEALFVALWRFIEAHGREERYGRRRKKYLYPGDGYKYWFMDKALTDESRIVNRMKIEDDLPRLIKEGQVE